MPRYWIVICPESHVPGGVWSRWFQENCVAIGWPPGRYHLEGPAENQGWAYARNRLAGMTPGDLVMPFLLRWRIGPVGAIRALRVKDDEWAPTVREGEFSLNLDEPELGRRIEVEWQADAMPPPGKVAVVPVERRGNRALALNAVEEVSEERFLDLVQVLGNHQNWVDLGGAATPPPPVPMVPEERGLSLLERDLQKFLARNLGLVEPGLKPSPDYQLEELITDVGRLDLFCLDSDAKFVVIELKAGTAGDDVIGQIGGYMAWVRDNVARGENVRGIIVCGDVTARTLAAATMIPHLKVKKYRLRFEFDDLV